MLLNATLAALVSAISLVSQLKEQRLERSRRHYSTRRRDVALPCIDFLQSERPAFLGAVELLVTTESAGAKFRRPVRRNLRRFLLSDAWRGLVFPRGSSSLLRRRKIIPRELATHRAAAMDHSLHRIGSMFAAIANEPPPRLAVGI